MDYKIVYNKNRFPVQPKRDDGTWGCRGCGGEIPKGRQTWCSRDCCELFHPAFVISNVRKRDKDICALCGFDYKQAESEWWKRQPRGEHYDWKASQRWLREKPQMNYDHIIPFSEGGLTILENIRTLCEPCHKKRTKDWHKERVRAKRQPQFQLLMLET